MFHYRKCRRKRRHPWRPLGPFLNTLSEQCTGSEEMGLVCTKAVLLWFGSCPCGSMLLTRHPIRLSFRWHFWIGRGSLKDIRCLSLDTKVTPYFYWYSGLLLSKCWTLGVAGIRIDVYLIEGLVQCTSLGQYFPENLAAMSFMEFVGVKLLTQCFQ